MEGDILGSKRVERLHVDLDAKGELGLEGEALFSEPSAISKLSSDDAKMDDEEKSSGSKRRCSRIDVRIDFEDDDAPIGSLFKLKRTRNPKKTNPGFDAGKSGKVEVRAESLIVKDEDLGEMDDTLASFRKKLKVPKKEGRLGMLKGRNSASNAAKHLDQSSNECVEDLDLVAKSQSNKSLSPDDNGSYLSRDDRLDGSKGRSKRSKHASASEKTKVNSKSDDKSDRPVVRRSRESSKQKHREWVLGFEEGSNPLSEGNFDDSLSTFVQKSQSSMARKTRSSSLSKQRVGTEVYEDGSKHMPSMIVQKSCLAPASKLGFKSKKSENVLDLLSDRSLKDPVPATVEAMKNGISDEDLSQASDCLKGNPLSSSVQELHPVPASMEEIVRSSYNTCDRSSEEIQDISVFTFPPSTTYSVSATHHKAHLTILHDDEFNRQTKGVHGGSTENCDGLRRDRDGVREVPLHVKVHDSCSAFIPKLTEETQRFQDGLKQCPKGKTNDLVHDAAELPSSVSATKKMGETNNRSHGLPTMISEDHPSSAVSNGDANLQPSSVLDDAFNVQKTQEAAGSSYDFDEQSIGVSEINLAATDENPSTASFSLPVTVNPVPCIDVDSLNKHSEVTHKGNTMDKFNCLNKLANKSLNESTGPVERSSSLPLTSQRNSSVTCNEQQKPFEMSLEGSLTSPVRCRSLQQVEIEEAPVLESGPDQFSDGYSEDSQLIQPQSSFPACGLTKQEETCSILGDTNQTPCNCIEDPLLALSSMQSLQVEEAVGSNARLSASVMASNMVIKSGSASENNPWEKSLYNGDVLHNDSVTSIQTYVFPCPEDQPSDDTSKGTCTTSHDSLPVKEEEAQGVCSPSITLDQNEICPEDAGMILDPEYKDIKLTAVQRVMRKAKRCKHGDMAYEGDTEWEILMHGQRCSESNRVVDGDQPFKIKEKSDPPSNTIIEGDSVGAAAVAAGLKARAAGPVEKVKFKEVLKRRGGLQEYLECRNMILGLWCKDVSCILPIEECGVTAAPSKDEPQRASLRREIYAFLDQNGYINVGIASRKEKCLPCRDAHSKLSEEKNPEENCVARIADSDGVAFILGRGKASEILTDTRNGAFSDDGKLISEVTEGRKSVMSNRGSELNTSLESEERTADNGQETDCINVKLPKIMTNLSALSTDPLSDIMDEGTESVLAPDLKSNSYRVQSAANDYMDGDDHVESEPKVQKKIIVVGAGPAGLTAARHLQRQGFSVTVLEARDRLGGRVYTDRSSLSVPVDLGASIITGVEADVATERRPDPSSLICAQLGLELTILNSDCPLYDIVTGKKVPADLDEALEAEYNSLLDDMVVLVAHKGERAMRMSLEDGLEYALKRRRMARSTTDAEEIELNASADTSVDTKNGGFDGKYLNGTSSKEDILSPLERRVMDWHFANLEYGCAALLKAVSLPYWNQDDVYGGFGGAHCMIKGGYSSVVESLGEGLLIHLNHVVTEVSYRTRETEESGEGWTEVKVSTSNGIDFFGDAVLITVPLGCLKADTIKFSPSLPEWKRSSIQRLGFGVLNKVVLEFPEVFWDDSVDYFGATAEETKWRGLCFMFWNVKKTVGAPVLIALVVGQAAIDGQNLSSSDHVNHAVMVLRKLFGDALVPNPIASVVTNWGGDPFSHGAYSYVAVGASGEDYDILGRPVENCLFFAGEATCKEHPDTVGGAMMSGLREAVRIIAIMTTGNDYTAEVQVIEAAQRHSDSERNEVRDIMKRLEAVELSNVLYKNSLDEDGMLTKEALVQDMFVSAKTTAGRLHLAKELLKLPVEALKSFSGTREGLSILNSWILDSMGKDGTQLLRHCVRILVRVSTDLLAVRLSGIGKTVKEKVCVHTSRDIRAVASQLVSMWIEVFRKEKASNGGLKLLRHTSSFDSFKTKSSSGKPPVRTTHGAANLKGNVHTFSSAGIHPSSNFNIRKANCKAVKLETITDLKSEIDLPQSLDLVHITDSKMANSNVAISEEEAAAIAAAEAARAAARAAAEAYASSEADCSTLRELPKIPSFHKFARREQYAQMDDTDIRRKKWVGGLLGRQDCISEIDSRNCRVRNWSVDFSATCVNPEGSRLSGDNYTQRSYSNEVACQLNHGEYSGESGAVDSRLTKAWVDSVGSGGVKDYHAIERWQSQAAAADSEFFHPTMHVRDEEDSNTGSKNWKHEGDKQESISSQAAENRELLTNQLKGAERIKQAVVDYVASLLMPLYKTRKIDKEGYKSIMKKSATKVMEQTTDAEKAMAASEFLDFKRKNKIRAFVDRLIERHMVMKPVGKP